jgi:nucleotide-binding universal stress UspA family protein
MSFVKILVPVTGVTRDRYALATAFAAAQPFHAHVVALFVHADPREAVPYGELPLSPDIIQDLIDTAADLKKASSKSARSTLASLAADAGIRIVAAPQKADSVTVSYEEMTGHLSRALDRAARLCDLVVFPPIRETDDPEIQDGFIRALTKLEHPVLLSAEKSPEHVGRKVAVAWDGGVACAHALLSALPYLKRAEKIEILSVQDLPSNGRGMDDVGGYLALHGLSCSQRVLPRGERNVAEVLVEAASNGGFDMLVAGGYGHSRLMETIFGGVTDHLVSHPRIPVFMMH